MPVKPFKLVPGCYVETTDGDLVGPVFQVNSSAYGVRGNPLWTIAGAPIRSTSAYPRIKTVITGPVGLNAYVDRNSHLFGIGDLRADKSLNLAQYALQRMRSAAAHDEKPPAMAIEAEPVGDAANRALETLLREIIWEEVRAVIREEMPTIVAEASNLFDGSDLRLTVTISSLKG